MRAFGRVSGGSDSWQRKRKRSRQRGEGCAVRSHPQAVDKPVRGFDAQVVVRPAVLGPRRPRALVRLGLAVEHLLLLLLLGSGAGHGLGSGDGQPAPRRLAVSGWRQPQRGGEPPVQRGAELLGGAGIAARHPAGCAATSLVDTLTFTLDRPKLKSSWQRLCTR